MRTALSIPFATAEPPSAAPLLAAGVLAVLGFYWLLPRPRGRSVALGTFAAAASAVVTASWALGTFGEVAADAVGTAVFCVFAAGALGFGGAFVVQRNPARGAIAFAFVIVSVSGLFLQLAAPFLAAATVIVYAGAVVVTFLFVLMLSHNDGPSDENDRTREPLLGSLAGFAFLGLVLLALQTAANDRDAKLPARPVTPEERTGLLAAAEQLRAAAAATTKDELFEATKPTRDAVAAAVGPSTAGEGRGPTPIPDRLALRADPAARATAEFARQLRDANQTTFDKLENQLLSPRAMTPADLDAAKQSLAPVRDRVLLLAGRGDLPARNVANIGYLLYSDYILAVEMAGTLLLVATIGAVQIASRKGVPA